MSQLYDKFAVRMLAQELLGLDGRCARRLLVDFDLRSPSAQPCVQLFVQRTLGLAVVVGASVVKLPQIGKVLLAQSTEGLSMLTPLLELVAASMSFAYHIRAKTSFLQYGETVMTSVQNAILIALFGLFGGRMLSTLVLSVAYAGLMSVALSPSRMNASYVRYLQVASVPMTAASRLPQLAHLLRTRQVGQVSAVSAVLAALGSTARLYTVRNAADVLTVGGALASVILNWLIVATVLSLSSRKALYGEKYNPRNPRKRKAA